jgi:hypothetical protein
MIESPRVADRVRAVVVLHSHNDMADNVTYRLYRSGFRAPTVSAQSRAISKLHLRNLVNYLRWVREQAGVDGKRDEGTVEAGKEVRPDLPRGLEDVLYAFPMRWTGKRRGNVDLGGGEQVEFTDIATHEYSARETKEREDLGEIQTRLLRRSIDELNCAVSEHPVPILHVVLHYAPPWYVEPLQKMVENSKTCGNDIRFGGRIPIPGEEFPAAFNSHSGGHFIPEVNARYAKEITALVLSTGAVGTRRNEQH